MKPPSKPRKTALPGSLFGGPYYRSNVARRALQLYDWLYESATTKAAPDAGERQAEKPAKPRAAKRRS